MFATIPPGTSGGMDEIVAGRVVPSITVKPSVLAWFTYAEMHASSVAAEFPRSLRPISTDRKLLRIVVPFGLCGWTVPT